VAGSASVDRGFEINMTGEQRITDGVIALREVANSDITRLYEWRNDPGTHPMFRDDRPLEFEAHSRFVRRYLESRDRVYWLIIEASEIPVGTISLRLSADGRECEPGRLIIAPAYRGAGYGRRALALLMTFAVSLGVERLSCEVLSSNEHILRICRSLGFTTKGIDDSGQRGFVLMEAALQQEVEHIHLFVPKYRTEEILAEMRHCLETGWTGPGEKTAQFEAAWRAYTSLEHAHFLNSATAGLHLAFTILRERYGWAVGDEILTTPFTFVSTNHTIVQAGLKPVFADIDEYLCLDPVSAAALISPRTRAVCFVGVGGHAGRYSEALQLCAQHDLRVILDASHMAGTRIHGVHAGHGADAAIFSFQAVKNLPTADSGMLCFRDAELDREARKWSWLGIGKDTFTRTAGSGPYKWKYDVEHLGFKYHGNAIMASMGLVGLRYLDQDNAYRRKLAGWYDEALAGCPEVRRIPQCEGVLNSRHLYQVLVEERDEVVRRLNERGIYPGVHYEDNTTYRMYRYAAGSCPRVAHASARVISLPMHLGLSEENVRRVAAALEDICR
jgi:dTDP-4-amino-4,6-dideoxygalactose transaminase/RimJ/RimL family protein N-acetyltransferase